VKIKFIGTSHGVPETDRKWTAVMIASGENTYLVDAGAFVADGIIRSGRTLDSLKGVFVTHRHGDHMNGLLSLVDIISWYYKNSEPAIFLPGEGIAEPLTALLDASFGGAHLKDLDYRVIKPGTVYDDGCVRVRAVPTKHVKNGELPSFAFIFECEGKRVLFTGDLSHSCEDYPDEAATEDIDLAVIEAAHFELTQREHIFSKTKTKKMCVAHFYPKRNSGEIDKFTEDMPFEVLLAHDGLELEI